MHSCWELYSISYSQFSDIYKLFGSMAGLYQEQTEKIPYILAKSVFILLRRRYVFYADRNFPCNQPKLIDRIIN